MVRRIRSGAMLFREAQDRVRDPRARRVLPVVRERQMGDADHEDVAPGIIQHQ